MISSEKLKRYGYNFLEYIDKHLHLDDEWINILNSALQQQRTDANHKYLVSLKEVLICYFHNQISADGLYFYLEHQFELQSNEIKPLLRSLNAKRSIRNQSKTNIPRENYAPKISVIITTYNRKEYLRQALQSIIMQHYPNIEIIVMDDASTDGTDKMLHVHYKNNPNIKYIKNEVNQGPGFNRKEAFKSYASGEYILFLDDDDFLIEPDYFTMAVDFHKAHPKAAFVAANVFIDDVKDHFLTLARLNFPNLIRKKEYFMMFEKKGYPKPASTLTTIFKRKSLEEMGLLQMNMVNDAAIYLRSLLAGDAGFLDIVAGVYRVHGQNITFSLSKDFILENIHEKITIKDLAVTKLGYSEEEMASWIQHHVYQTVKYYLKNSSKTRDDDYFMFNWIQKNFPDLYRPLKRVIQLHRMKKRLLLMGPVRSFVQNIRKN